MLISMNLPKKIKGWAASSAGGVLEEREFPFPAVGAGDVVLEVLHCGVCHSDVHLIQNDWKISQYPLVPGHEILGRVVAVGSGVSHLRVGDMAGVGWQSSSCGHCRECVSGNENFCDSQGATCNGHLGGYADYHVTSARFCFPVPAALARPEVAPLFCGGITVYSPLCEFVSRKDARVAVLGLGGLGHLAVKFSAAMGHEVAVISSTPSKEKEARALGATSFLHGSAADVVKAAKESFDLVLVTANVDLPYVDYLRTLRRDGTLCFVGIPPSPITLGVGALLGSRLRVAASPIGSPSRILDMLDFARVNGVLATSEIMPMAKANEAVARVKKNDVRYRAVLSRA
jgi:uncharacterized zinc-type alcohol dehydrogenase-like protein